MMSHPDSEAPAVGQQVITACAFIHQRVDGIPKVFMARRSMNKKFLPGVYELPGGHVEFGEDPIVGLKREVREELALDINVGDPFAAFTYTNELKGSHSIEVIYFATLPNDTNDIILNLQDHSEYGWFAEDELASATTLDKSLEDDEFTAIKTGFRILAGTYDVAETESE